MGNTAQSARFRGLVQVLGEKAISDTEEIAMYRGEFWALKLDSPEDFYSKFTAQDARDIFELGNAFFLIDESVERLETSKTACRVLSRLIPVLFAAQMSLPSAHSIGPAILTAMCEDRIGFDDEKEVDGDLLWETFAGAQLVRDKDSGLLDDNRIELLRLLVVALSEPLFNKAQTAGEVQHFVFDGIVDSSYADESISERASNLFVSMLAVVSKAGSSASYGRAELGTHCQNALAVLMDQEPGETSPLTFVITNLPLESRRQVVQGLISKLEREKCVNVSTLCLLWRLFDLQAIRETFTDEMACSLAFTLVKAMYEYRKDSRLKHSSVQLSSILMFSLTCDRKTGLALNRVLDRRHFKALGSILPIVITADWSYIDVVVTCIVKFVSEGDTDMFEPLMRLSLSGIANLSWYIKALHSQTSALLVGLLDRVAKRKFFFAKETNYLFAKTLVEVINNMLQYQSQGNSHLLYAIMRMRHIFYNLQDLQLPSTFNNPSASVDLQVEESKSEEVKPSIHQNQDEKFRPSKEWLDDVKSKMPLSAIIYATRELGPKLDLIVSGDERDFLKVIEESTLVGALPPPPPIVISKYARTDKIDSIIRRSFWIDLYRGDDYGDLWLVPTHATSTRPREESV